MKKLTIVILSYILAFVVPNAAIANECFVAGNFTGQTATSFERFQFSPDSFSDGMLLCFEGDTVSVTGNDLQLVQFGENTAIGWANNGAGLETVNVYQIDRQNRKVYITTSRIGTKTQTGNANLLPDYVGAFVGDIVPAN